MQVVKQIKTDENLKDIPIVMLTSSREEKDLVESYRLGVNAYVVKPVSFEKFVDTIKQIGIFWTLINEPPL
jgi:CheY-like chemotaxis protein